MDSSPDLMPREPRMMSPALVIVDPEDLRVLLRGEKPTPTSFPPDEKLRGTQPEGSESLS
jgi:hypothetical protein